MFLLDPPYVLNNGIRERDRVFLVVIFLFPALSCGSLSSHAHTEGHFLMLPSRNSNSVFSSQSTIARDSDKLAESSKSLPANRSSDNGSIIKTDNLINITARAVSPGIAKRERRAKED